MNANQFEAAYLRFVELCQEAAIVYGTSMATILSGGAHKDAATVAARMDILWRMDDEFDPKLSQPKMAKMFQMANHTTVLLMRRRLKAGLASKLTGPKKLPSLAS